MKNQHTPGPWIVRGGNAIENETGVNIAKAWMTDCEEECANANLISACPDMFDALQAICDAFGDQDSLLIDQCKAAFSKAKGQAK